MDKGNVGSNYGFRGRAKAAPYKTMHYRIPLPIKPMVEVIANKYRELVKEFDNPEDPELIATVISALNSTHKQPQQKPVMKVELIAIICPACGSNSIKKYGTRNNKQRYECKECKRTFSQPRPTRNDD